MRDLQEQVLNRNIDRLSKVLIRAERRCARYSEHSISRNLDLAFVERIAISLHQLKKFQREHGFNESRDEMMGCLRDAVTQLHELCDFARDEIEGLDEFQSKFFKKEERWVRMINISTIGLFINICADHIRYGLHQLERQTQKLNILNTAHDSTIETTKKPHLYIVK